MHSFKQDKGVDISANLSFSRIRLLCPFGTPLSRHGLRGKIILKWIKEIRFENVVWDSLDHDRGRVVTCSPGNGLSGSIVR